MMIITKGLYNYNCFNEIEDDLSSTRGQLILPVKDVKQLISGGFGMIGLLLNTGGKLWLNNNEDKFKEALKIEDIKCIAIGYNFIITYNQKLKQHEINASATFKTSIRDLNFPNWITIKQISCGEHHVLALGIDGSVWTWGKNLNNQLGSSLHHNIEDILTEPENILGPNGHYNEILLKSKFKKVRCGIRHSLALTETGEVITWGCNLHGQCGQVMSQDNIKKPTLIKELQGLAINDISAGLSHTLCCSDFGDVYVCGSNMHGQLGLDSVESKFYLILNEAKILENEKIIKVCAGSRHSLALAENGKVFGWGWNEYHQISMKNEVKICYPILIEFESESESDDDNNFVVDIETGWWHSLFQISRQNVEILS